MVAAKVVTDDCYGGLCIDEGDYHLGWRLASGMLGGGGDGCYGFIRGKGYG